MKKQQVKVKIRNHEGRFVLATPEQIMQAAREVAAEYYVRETSIVSVASAGEFFLNRMIGLESEEFHVLFLDSQHKVIDCEKMFQGTIDSAAVYPREVVKSALRHNAAAVVFAHNHPSGDGTFSKADIGLTETLKSALSLVTVRVLDHILIAGARHYSMAEKGLM